MRSGTRSAATGRRSRRRVGDGDGDSGDADPDGDTDGHTDGGTDGHTDDDGDGGPGRLRPAVGRIAAMDEPRPLSALPSVGVRVAAFVSILLAGLAGGLIGYSLVALQCDGDCGIQKGLGIVVGSLLAAGGMAVVAVLVMRAIGEWREVQDRERAGHAL